MYKLSKTFKSNTVELLRNLNESSEIWWLLSNACPLILDEPKEERGLSFLNEMPVCWEILTLNCLLVSPM